MAATQLDAPQSPEVFAFLSTNRRMVFNPPVHPEVSQLHAGALGLGAAPRRGGAPARGAECPRGSCGVNTGLHGPAVATFQEIIKSLRIGLELHMVRLAFKRISRTYPPLTCAVGIMDVFLLRVSHAPCTCTRFCCFQPDHPPPLYPPPPYPPSPYPPPPPGSSARTPSARGTWPTWPWPCPCEGSAMCPQWSSSGRSPSFGGWRLNCVYIATI